MKTIELKIDYLKREMYKLIREKGNLLDPEIQKISQKIDELMIIYYNNKLNKV